MHSLGSMVIKVVLLDVPKVTIAEVVVVHAVVRPLFSNISLHQTTQHHWSGVNREEEESQGQRNQKDRKNILQSAIDVRAIERSFVMTKVCGVEILVGKVRKIFLVFPG